MTGLIKFILRGLLRLLYGVRVHGMEHYSEAGDRVLIIANHTSLLDGILLYAWLPETPTFAINTRIAAKRKFRFFMAFVDLFTMDPTSALSVKSMIKFIRQDKKAVIFPEGRITITGAVMKVYEGPGLVADKADAMILPVAIDGAQYSPFSYMHGRGFTRWFPRITLSVLPPERISINPDLRGHARRKAAAAAMQKLMFKLAYHTYDYNRTILDALLESMRRFGRNSLILEDFNREPISYGQLFTRAWILARVMGRNTASGEHVGLLMPNVNTTAIAFLALQYLGRVPAMLNYSAGTQAMVTACATGRIHTVYSSRRFIESAGLQDMESELGRHVRLIYLEDVRAGLTLRDRLTGILQARFPRHCYRRSVPQPDPDGAAVILFTSGSEGLPKGVVLTHVNILSNFAQVRVHIDFRPSDILFACLPLFHSFGLNAGLIMPLLGGSKVFLYPTPLHYRIIPELIYELGATILFGTNTFFKGYARHAHAFDFNSLRYVVAGAEKLHDDTRQLWMDRFGIRILEGYGVTESSPVISVNTPIVNKTGTVGQLLPGMEYRLLSVDGIEEGGRLIVRGPNVMRGYLLHGGDGRIIPTRSDAGADWHDTGDIAAIDNEGFIRILGRARRFAKVGGEMVSLTAVEELATLTWPDFNHAAVNLPDEKKGEKIILVTDHAGASRRDIQETARTLKYSELYVPRRVVLAEELPVLGTGKTDYVTLTELALAEDREGSGLIKNITGLKKKPDKSGTEAHNPQTAAAADDS
jgi:acyl-[acyl-carrier-protein]-phospholipid O-acyltransferase/long-chain-fatty-acid--[acyl-carrier-protein] ligase